MVPSRAERCPDFCDGHDVEAVKCTHWADGGKGMEALAKHVAGAEVIGLDAQGQIAGLF